jgi:hypothetical protein
MTTGENDSRRRVAPERAPGDLRPVLLLDVDGVTSPLSGGHLGRLPETWVSWRRLEMRMPVWVAPDCIARLSALPVERIWCSTWQGMVDAEGGLSEQLGWSGMPWLRLPGGDRPWNKRRAIESFFKEHGVKPFAWADDDARLVSSGRPWARRLPVPSLLIRPQKKIGLTPAHLDAMERWVGQFGAIGGAADGGV